MAPTRVSKTLVQRCITLWLRLWAVMYLPLWIDTHTLSCLFLCCQSLRPWSPLNHILQYSPPHPTHTHLKPSSCTTVINQNKTLRFTHLFVVFKLHSHCFSQLMLTLALQGAHYRCRFIHDGAEAQRGELLVQRHTIVTDGASFLFTSNVFSSLTGRYTYCRKAMQCMNGISKEMKIVWNPPT